MSMGKFKFLMVIAGVAMACTANAQYLTGALGVTEASPQDGAFTSSSLSLDPTNIIMSDSGVLGSLVPSFGDLLAYPGIITGLSTNALADPINDFFVFSTPDPHFGSSGTSPSDRFEFNLATITEYSYDNPAGTADFTGTGTLVDILGDYQPTSYTFNLSFSGPNSYSFSFSSVPEPSSFALMLIGLGAVMFLYRKKQRRFNS